MNNVVQLSQTSDNNEDIGRVWLIDEIQVGASHSIVLSITVKKFDDEDNSIEASVLFYDACRFEYSDFIDDTNELKKESKSLLDRIDGVRRITSSNYLDETKNKFEIEYPSRKNPKLLHYIIFDEVNLVNVISETAPKIIFRKDEHTSEFIPEKVTK